MATDKNPAPLTVSDVTLLEKRLWCYVQQPAVYEIAPHDCGHNDAQWSEYDKHLWCPHCEVDFIPSDGGIFSGPIAIGLSTMLGVCFDRVNIATGKVDRFDTDAGRYESDKETAEPQG